MFSDTWFCFPRRIFCIMCSLSQTFQISLIRLSVSNLLNHFNPRNFHIKGIYVWTEIRSKFVFWNCPTLWVSICSASRVSYALSGSNIVSKFDPPRKYLFLLCMFHSYLNIFRQQKVRCYDFFSIFYHVKTYKMCDEFFISAHFCSHYYQGGPNIKGIYYWKQI